MNNSSLLHEFSYLIYSDSFCNWDSIEFGMLTIWELTNYQIQFNSLVVDFKMKDENITTEAIGVSSRSIERNIEKLKQEGKIKRIGADKGGYWKVIG